MSKATVVVTGRAARDAQPIGNGNPMAKISIPSGHWMKGEEVTTWWSVTLWGKDAEFAVRNVKKGDVVHIAGNPYMQTYRDKDGEERTQLCIDARAFSKIASGNNDGAQNGSGFRGGNGRNGGGQNQGWGNVDNDPVPF